MRSRHRLFYLIRDDGGELTGAVSEDMLPAVRANLGERVSVDLVVTKTVSGTHPERRAYELVSLGLTKEQRSSKLALD